MSANKDDLSSPNFSTTNGKSSSYFQRTVCMSDWWLMNSENEFQGKRLAVAGISSRGQRAVRVFNSAPIVLRYDPFTLETADGICVVLESLINKSRTSENGFSSEVVRRFMLGFPPYWEKYAVTEGDASNCNHVVHDDKNELEVSKDMSGQSSFPSADPVRTTKTVEKHAAIEETYQMNITSTSLNSDTLRSLGGNDQNPASGSMDDVIVTCTHVSENNENFDRERLYSSPCAKIQPGVGLDLLGRSPKHSTENVLRKSKRNNKHVTRQEMDQVNITSSNLRVDSDVLNNQDEGNTKNPSSASYVDHKIKKCTLASENIENLDGEKQNNSRCTTIQFEKEVDLSRKSQDHYVQGKEKRGSNLAVDQLSIASNNDRVGSYALRSLDQQNPKSGNKRALASKTNFFGGEKNNLSRTSVQPAKVALSQNSPIPSLGSFCRNLSETWSIGKIETETKGKSRKKKKSDSNLKMDQLNVTPNSDRVGNYALRSLDEQNPESGNKRAPASKKKNLGEKQNGLSCTPVQSAEVTPCNEKSRTTILSPESLSCKRSRSGRLLLPSLQFWRNQLPVYDADGKIAGIQEEVPVLASRGTPSKPREKKQHQQR